MRGTLGTPLGVIVLGAAGSESEAPTTHDALLTDFIAVEAGAFTAVDAPTLVTIAAPSFIITER